jgi:hypothetical protein
MKLETGDAVNVLRALIQEDRTESRICRDRIQNVAYALAVGIKGVRLDLIFRMKWEMNDACSPSPISLRVIVLRGSGVNKKRGRPGLRIAEVWALRVIRVSFLRNSVATEWDAASRTQC